MWCAAVALIVPPLVDIATLLVPLAASGVVLLMIGAAATHLRRREYPNVGVPRAYGGRHPTRRASRRWNGSFVDASLSRPPPLRMGRHAEQVMKPRVRSSPKVSAPSTSGHRMSGLSCVWL
ncbi:DoxX family protein [Amycolatopsis sp. NPDC051371]|uniref:DoxX family protein n=1 Tax=Amycolatopsis sp. NPDC051371 TaxID=3155800 RepID=UPI003446622C